MAKILVVDDLRDNRVLLAGDLEDLGYDVAVAESGQRGLELALSENPSVVLLDIMMPGMDGVEVCRRLKEDPQTEHIPVILISALDAEADIIDGLDAGAHDYIPKPYVPAIMGARVRAAVRVRESRDTIDALNSELDEFNRAASHDMKAPLRRILTFAEFLREDLESPSDDIMQNVGFIESSARRMVDLVDKLLAYSRAGRSPLAADPVPLEYCVQASIAALSLDIDSAGATLRQVPLPDVYGDQGFLAQLFENLIANALKYSDSENPCIEITCCEEDGETVFGVKDNGIGIAPESSTEIFAPFRRLHAQDRFTGTGIGLSICQRIVERHEGRIWVESSLGNGAHFRFTLGLTPETCDVNGTVTAG